MLSEEQLEKAKKEAHENGRGIWKAILRNFKDEKSEVRTKVLHWMTQAFIELLNRIPDEQVEIITNICCDILKEFGDVDREATKGGAK